ncbi:MAG: PAS domain S-box protein, partial [Deltaproteobacteria bacterium]|nr:PAS domain S-box protein [Deltaproteobacteria bacterium]
IAIAVDDIHENLIYFNKQFLKLFGYSDEEMKSKTHKTLVHPDDFEMVSKYHEKRMQDEETPSRYEFRGIRNDGSIVNIEIDVCEILTKENEISGSRSYLWDITKRKKTEETLRTSKAQLSNAMEIAKLGYWEYDVDADLFTFNDHFYDIFRTTAKKAGGYKMSLSQYAERFLHPDDIAVVANEMKKAMETTDPNFTRTLEHRIIYADGEIGYISVRFFIVKDSQGRTVKTFGANQDITKRKILEDELRDSEIRYHNLFENSSEFLFTLDLKGNFTDVNKAAKALTGYTKPELLKMNFKDYTLQRDHKILLRTFHNVYKTGKPFQNFPVEAIIKDKSIKYFETSFTLLKKGDQIIGFHGSSKDITERKRAENALRESEERYRSLVENIDFGVTMIDKDFKIIMTNGIIGQWHNKPTYKFEGKNCFEEFEKRQAICQHCPGVKAMATGQPHQVETEGVRDDGSHFSVLVHAFPLSGPDDVVKGFIEVIEDITERKRAEEELIRAKEKAEAGNRLKTAFMNNISHEVRTPLNGILGFSNLITQPGITDEEKVEYYTLIKTSSNRLLNTISNYMDSSLIASGTMEVNRKYMDLHPMLHQLRAQFQPLCDHKNLECHLQLPGKTEPITIYSDEELFRKVLCHLLDNAAKFTTKGGITFGYAIKPGVLEFFVKDTGSGISKEAQTRIFESFVQEELLHTRGYEGSGLGLSIAQGFVRLLGGEMGLESEKGAGSTFFFTLPWEEKETGIITKTEGIQKGVLAENQVILIVEDDESNLLFIQTILRKAAVTVLVANNGKEAVDGCRAHPEISLVLMDLRMPVMDGLEATRVIKTFRKNLPIIAITAFAMSGD